MKFKKKLAVVDTVKYYRSIDELPIGNFNKINETSDYRYLIRLEDYYELPEKVDSVKLSNLYEEILMQLFVKFGFDETFISGLREEKAILILKLKVIAGERTLQAVVDIKEQQINDRSNVNKKYKADFDKKVATLEVHFKMPFDVNKMSTLRFFTYASMYTEYVKKNAQYSAVK